MLANLKIAAVLTLFTFAFANVNANPILNVDHDGILMGATRVMVAGKLFDVEFADGECGGIANLCDTPSNFMFNTSEAARAASQALLDQIFLDIYDENYTLTNGCQNLIWDRSMCAILTPYETQFIDPYVFIKTEMLINGITNELQSFGLLGTDSTKTTWDYATYAIWRECVETPESNLNFVFLLAVALLLLRRSRVEPSPKIR